MPAGPQRIERFSGFGNTGYPREVLIDHVRAALERGLAEVEPVGVQDHPVVLVGSGPSVVKALPRLRAWSAAGKAMICAVKSAHDWLRSEGIVPDFAVAMDPRPTIGLECFRRAGPETLYFLASQCHPDLFDHLAGCPVMLCHAKAGSTAHVPGPKVDGGCTTGLRAIHLMYLLGYRHAHLVGYDSCHGTGDERLRKVTGERAQTFGMPVSVRVGSRVFETDEHLAQQAMEFAATRERCAGMKIEVHGRGLLARVAKEVECSS